jgi:replication factor C subunit 2/4
MQEEIWLEKYRPKYLDEMVGNQALLKKLKDLAFENNVPNLILTGPPGCGKTTSIMALCREILQDNFKNATLELNASDDRGIDVVREKIKQFAEKKVKLPQGQHKVIILDEADSLTDAAQQALRMIISDHSSSTRFVFSCNDSSKIIEPLQSRCAVLRFNKLGDVDILEYLLKVIKAESIAHDKAGLDALIFISDGDMRNAINNLQAVCVARSLVSKENVYEICDVPKIEEIKDIFIKAKMGQLDEVLMAFENIWNQDYCVHDLINYMSKVLEKSTEFDQSMKFKFINKIGELKIRDSIGLGSKIQILGTLAELCQIAKEEVKVYQ